MNSLLVLVLWTMLQDPARDTVPVDMDAKGKLSIKGESVRWQDLKARLMLLKAAGVRKLTLRGDPEAAFSHVQNLMATAKSAGLPEVLLVTKKDPPPIKLSAPKSNSLRIKIRKGGTGPEIVLLRESTVKSMAEFRRYLSDSEKVPVVIDAEFEIRYSVVQRVLESCTESGFTKITFAAPPLQPRAINVLYAESLPRWEFRYLRNLLRRSKDFSVKIFLANPEPGFPDFLSVFPGDLSEYDVVLMGDVHELKNAHKLALVRFVQEGGGIVWLAPERNPLDWLGNELVSICPLTLSARPRGGGIPLAPLMLTVRAKENKLAKVFPWKAMSKKVHTAWATRKVDDDAEVLVESTWGMRKDKNAFLVIETVGKGRAAYVGADDTWRWRQGTGDEPHFGPLWRAVLRWAATGK